MSIHPFEQGYELTVTGGTNKNDPSKYTETLKRVCTIKSAEELSYILHHIHSFEDSPPYNLNIFKKGVNASWEHPDNINGCSWIFQVCSEVGNVLFERLCVYFCLVGFKTFECCGIKVNIRKGFVKFEVWAADVPSVVESADVLEDLRKSLGMEFPVNFTYKNHKKLLSKVNEPVKTA